VKDVVEGAARRRRWLGAGAVVHPITSAQDHILLRVVVVVRRTSVREPINAYIFVRCDRAITQNNMTLRSGREEIRL
jgi:hypothetical protein